MSALDTHACDNSLCGYETTIVEVMTAYKAIGSDAGPCPVCRKGRLRRK
jgi:hypothetical protein